jgi:adenylate cyclase
MPGLTRLNLIIALLLGLSRAQKTAPPGVDAVLQKIGQMKDDTNKVNAYFLDGTNLIYLSEKAPVVYSAVADLAEKLHFYKGVVKAHLFLGSWYNDRADYIKALTQTQLALRTAYSSAREMAPQSLEMSRLIYRGLQNFEKAVDCDYRVLKIQSQSSNDTLVCNVYIVLANDYGDWKKYDASLAYARKAMALAEKLDHRQLKGVAYSELGWIYYVLKNYEPALHYSQKSLATLGKDDPASFNTLGTLGEIYRDLPEGLLIKIGIRPAQRDLIVLNYFEKSLAGAKKAGILSSIPDHYLNISRSYARIGNYRQAYQSYRNYILYRDSSANEKQQKLMILTEARSREAALKYKQQLNNIKTRQQRNYYLSGIAALLLISFFVARNYFIQRKLNKLINIEKQRSDDLLNNILPSDVAEELKQKGEAKARHFEKVTVLFTDFVQFTTISQQLSPQELVDELNACFKAFDHIITDNNIEKIKTVGDAYLAVSGLPNPDPNHAGNVVTAALAIQKFMRDRKVALGNRTFDIRIGIYSGSVVAGIVGVKKFAYDIWGDTVNTAARMEQNSEPGKINISETTRELLGAEFPLIYRGEIEAKNKGLLKMYFVESDPDNLKAAEETAFENLGG